MLELASRLAAAGQDEAAIVEAIHGTPSAASMAPARSHQPWRVIVECPVATGEPPTRHQVVFSGDGSVEPVEVLGTPAAAVDTVLDGAAQREAVLPFPARRAERRLGIAVLSALAIGTLVLVLTWISGALALAARETPVWLGLSLTLAVAAIAIGAVTLASRSQAEGNANDTLVLRRHYDSRIDMLWYATVAMGLIFALALAVGHRAAHPVVRDAGSCRGDHVPSQPARGDGHGLRCAQRCADRPSRSRCRSASIRARRAAGC